MAQSKRITPALLRAHPLPQPREGDKEARGRVLVIAGSSQMPGPVILAAESALRAGAGKLQIATDAQIAANVACAVPEALVTHFGEAATLAERADAIVFGPGMDAGAACSSLLQDVIERAQCTLVLDAASLCDLPAIPQRARAIVTPHTGEMAKMLGAEAETVERDRAGAAVQAARRFNAIVAFKARETIVATPEGDVYANTRGHWGLATSGSGDTLAGVIGGIAARGIEPLYAALYGVYAHACAGERLGRRIGVGFLAREIPAEIPHVLRTLQA